MSAARTTLLHTGTHRTGTTLIQSFLRNEIGAPVFPEGFYTGYENCHDEWLVASSLDFARADRAPTREKLRREAASEAPLLVYSCETISIFRNADRVARVRELVGARRLHVVLYAREPQAFLKSYRLTRAALGMKPSDDRDSEDYYSEDYYGHDSRLVDFDAVSAKDGSVVPSFAELLGATPRAKYFLNSSRALKAHTARLREERKAA